MNRPVAIVVGGSSGLGAAIARALVVDGHRVFVLSRTAPPAGTCDEFIACDVSRDEAVVQALSLAPREVDCLVYVAGEPVMGLTLAVPQEVARASFEVNFWGLDRVVRGVLPGMMERGRGTILSVLSLAAVRAVPHEAYYAGAKAAQARFLECLSHEAAPRGVRIKYLCPGFVDTGFLTRRPWFGMSAPVVQGSNVSPLVVAAEVIDLLHGSEARRVVGWRERAIVLADRVVPGLYDRLLQKRLRGRVK